MTYPSEWKGSTQAEVKDGVATFIIEGSCYSLKLECFSDYQAISQMLEVAFDQGKRFAADAMRSHIHAAIEKARQDHAL